MKMKFIWMPAVACLSAAQAQDMAASLPIEDLVAKQDQVILDSQGLEIFRAMDEVAAPYRQSVVSIIAGDRKIVSGLVVSPGKVMSKYSDLAVWKLPLAVLDANNKVHDMRVVAASKEHDVLLIDVPGLDAPAVDFDKIGEVEEGSMVFVLAPEGKVSEFGVISVDQRSLRDEDRAYIGIEMDPRWTDKGTRVYAVDMESPAYQAGIRSGDIVRKVNGKEVDGILSMHAILKNVNPGDKIDLSVLRGDAEVQGSLTVARRHPALSKYRSFPQGRLEQMNSMGNRMSKRRDRFPLVYQSDITLKPERAGSPVLDLEGRFVGMALSRAGRIETYILPAWVIRQLKDSIMTENAEQDDIPAAEPVT